jgi:hypothetical protein
MRLIEEAAKIEVPLPRLGDPEPHGIRPRPMRLRALSKPPGEARQKPEHGNFKRPRQDPAHASGRIECGLKQPNLVL